MDFLRTKASNFRAMLSEQPQSEQTAELMKLYNEDDLVPLIRTHLLPLYFTGTLDAAVSKVAEVFPSVDSDKVKRYLLCFCECVLKSYVS
jgi:hypothetical protein